MARIIKRQKPQSQSGPENGVTESVETAADTADTVETVDAEVVADAEESTPVGRHRTPSIAWSENDRDLALVQAIAQGINTLPDLYAHLKADPRFEGQVLTPLKITQRLGVLRRDLKATKGITLPRLQASSGDRRRGAGAGRRYVPDVDAFADILNAAGVAVPVEAEEEEDAEDGNVALEHSATAEAQVGA